MRTLAQLVAAGVVAEDVPLGPLTTYKFGGPARWLVAARDAAMVAECVDAARAAGVPYLVLGRGSNLVISDSGFAGLVVRLAGALAAMHIDDTGIVTAGAALPLPKLARECAKHDRGGLEFLVAVPGSVGGAVRMNAGCHGSETGEWLRRVEVYRPGTGVVTVERAEMEMSYRFNSLPTADVVLSAEFFTEPRRRDEAEAIMRSITSWRKTHQPGGTFNAGSVFKNPEGISAGELIDSLGLKGLRVGGAVVSTRHANFFEAGADAAAQDVYDLVHEVQHRVAAGSGIVLEPELRFAGVFREDPRRPPTAATEEPSPEGEEA